MNDSPHGRGGERKAARFIGIGVMLIVAAALWYSFRDTQHTATTAASRTAFDFVVTWRCLACGAAHDDRAAVGPHRCGKCGEEEAYASIRYACPTHGPVAVAFQYNERGRPVQIRVGSGAWIAYFDGDGNLNTRCPKCRLIMNPVEAPRPRRHE